MDSQSHEMRFAKNEKVQQKRKETILTKEREARENFKIINGKLDKLTKQQLISQILHKQ